MGVYFSNSQVRDWLSRPETVTDGIIFVFACKWGKHRSVGAACCCATWAEWDGFASHSYFTSLNTHDFGRTPYYEGGSCKFHGTGACGVCDPTNPRHRLEILIEGYDQWWN